MSQGGAVEGVITHEQDDIADMQHAFDLVEVVAVGNKTTMPAGGDLLHDVVPVVVEVHTFEFVTRHHRFADGDVFEFENTEQHVLLFAVFGVVPAGLDDAFQFVVAQCFFDGVVGFDTERAQDEADDEVNQGDDRRKEAHQASKDAGDRQGDARRMQRGIGFRRNFGEDEDGNGEGDGGVENAEVAVETDADDGAERGGGDVDEVVAEQDGADEAVGAFQQMMGAVGAFIAFVRLVFELVAVERHHRGFRSGEEG